MTSSLSPERISSILAGPAATPPPGVVPNFHDPTNRQLEGRAFMAIGLVIMVLPLIMRLYTQWFISKTYVIEDGQYFLPPCWMFAVLLNADAVLIVIAAGLTVALFAGEYLGLSPGHTSGYHIWDITFGDFYASEKLVNLNEILYPPAVTFVKLAILLQIRRIFVLTRRNSPWLWLACWTLIVITPIFYTIVMFFVIFECSPREKIWKPFSPGHCVSFAKIDFIATSSFNVISDVLILVLPLPAIYKLHMNIRKKLLVGGLFATGSLACVASALRLYYSYLVIDDPDTSWNYLSVGVTAFYEDAIGIVVFCLPVAPKFFQVLRKRLNDLRSGRSGSECSSNDALQPTYHHAHAISGAPKHRGQDSSSLGVSSIRQYLKPKANKSGRDAESVNLEHDGDQTNFAPSGESVHMDVITKGEDRASHVSFIE